MSEELKFDYDGKLIIATPFYEMKGFSPYIQSLVATSIMLERLNIKWDFWPLSGDSYVDRARNTICAKFLESDATDLLFIDSDESWDALGVLRLLKAPHDVVGGSYPVKNNWGCWGAILKQEDGVPIGQIQPDGGALLEAAVLPAGFMRIRKPALHQVMKLFPSRHYHDSSADPENPLRKYYAFFECSIKNGLRLGEDYTFCERYKATGGKLWVEPRISFGHYGVKGWEGNLDKHLRGLDK